MDELISYLKVEIKRIERIIDGDYADFMTLEEYHHEKGRVEALDYVWKRLNEILEEEWVLESKKNGRQIQTYSPYKKG